MTLALTPVPSVLAALYCAGFLINGKKSHWPSHINKVREKILQGKMNKKSYLSLSHGATKSLFFCTGFFCKFFDDFKPELGVSDDSRGANILRKSLQLTNLNDSLKEYDDGWGKQ